MSNPELDQSVSELRELAETYGTASIEYNEAYEILSQQYGSDLSGLGIEPPGDQTNGKSNRNSTYRFPSIPNDEEP